MRIRSARLLPYRLPLRTAWQTSHGRFTERRGWLVRLETDCGAVGWGDCAPLPEAGTESADEAKKWLHAILPRLAKTDPGNAPLDDAPPATRCALQTASLDLCARAAGASLAHFLTPAAAKRVTVAGNAGALASATAHRLGALVAAGYRVIKVKVGVREPGRELELLRTVASVLPAGIELRLDANQAWGEAQAHAFVAGLRDLPIESLEEPLRRPKCAALASLQAEVPFPLALDESLAGTAQALSFREPPVSRLILKPMVLGGPLRALHIAQRARSAGMECVVTTTVDSAVGTWAAAHLAAAVDGDAGGPAHGLATGEWLSADVGLAPRAVDGTLQLSEAPGLGVTPEAD